MKQPNLQEPMFDVYEPWEPEADKPEADDFTPETYDATVSAELFLPKENVLLPAKVIGWKHDAKGNPIGKVHSNPIIDSRVYKVQFPDGNIEDYAANVIVENMYSQVDAEGHWHLLLDEIINHHQESNPIRINDNYIQGHSNKTYLPTTIGWKVQVRWRDGTTSWNHFIMQNGPIQFHWQNMQLQMA